jgi:hypothetical protein
MFINTENKIKISASPYEWSALKEKMLVVASNNELQPSQTQTIIYYLWGFNFGQAFTTLYNKTTKIDLFNKEKDIIINFHVVELMSILLCCRPVETDNNYLRRIISKIDQIIPVEISQTINKFLQ